MRMLVYNLNHIPLPLAEATHALAFKVSLVQSKWSERQADIRSPGHRKVPKLQRHSYFVNRKAEVSHIFYTPPRVS